MFMHNDTNNTYLSQYIETARAICSFWPTNSIIDLITYIVSVKLL